MTRSHLSAAVVMVATITSALVTSHSNRPVVVEGPRTVNRMAMSADCHAPALASGQPDGLRQLIGPPIGLVSATPSPNRHSRSPNLISSGIPGCWADKRMAKLLITGIAPPADRAGPPMHQNRLVGRDSVDVTAYMRSLPAKR